MESLPFIFVDCIFVGLRILCIKMKTLLLARTAYCAITKEIASLLITIIT